MTAVFAVYVAGWLVSTVLTFRAMCRWTRAKLPRLWEDEGPTWFDLGICAAMSVIWPVWLPVSLALLWVRHPTRRTVPEWLWEKLP